MLDPLFGDILAATCAVTWAFTVMGYRWIVARGGSIATAAASGNLTACVVALVMAQPLEAGRPVDWAVVLFLLIEPVLNPVWAWLVHGERPGPAALVGVG